MSISIEDYVAGGYLVTQFIDSASCNRWLRSVAGATEDLLPDKMLSAGFCGANHAPVFSWAGNSEAEYLQFGILTDQISQIDTWANERLNKDVGYPNVFFRLSTAREYIGRFISKAHGIQLLGLGLHKERLHQITAYEQVRPQTVAESCTTVAGFADTGFAQTLHLGEQPVSGEILGFDVVCCCYNIDHSWHCNGLAVDGLEKFGFRPNQYGLINTKADADKLADYAEEIQPEPGMWLPILITRYALKEYL